MKELIHDDSSPSSSQSTSPALPISVEQNPEASDPSSKRFRLLSSFIEERMKHNMSKQPSVPHEEVNRYFNTTTSLSEAIDPVYLHPSGLQTSPQDPLGALLSQKPEITREDGGLVEHKRFRVFQP